MGEMNVIMREGRSSLPESICCGCCEGGMGMRKVKSLEERDMGVSIYSSGSTGVCFIQGYFLPRWHQHHHNSLFLPLSPCFSTPPFSSLLLFLTHTLPHRECRNRWKSWSESSETLVCFRVEHLCVAKPSPALLGKYWTSHHEKVKPCFSGRGFLTACGHLPVVVKTGMLLLYEDRGMMTVKAIWWCVWGM